MNALINQNITGEQIKQCAEKIFQLLPREWGEWSDATKSLVYLEIAALVFENGAIANKKTETVE